MAGVTAQGGTFTFSGFVGAITSISVESPQAEVIDMTPADAPVGQVILVPTGQWKGGSINVDYIHIPGSTDPTALVRSVGQVTFASGGYSVTRQAILESASKSASVGDAVRGSLKFLLTDYTG